MDSSSRLLQRFADGAASTAEAQLVSHLVQHDEESRQRLAIISSLDSALRHAYRQPRETRVSHDLVLQLIKNRLPTTIPKISISLTLADLLYGVMLVGLVGFGYGVLGSLSAQPVLLLTIAIFSLIGGLALTVLAGTVRRLESSVLGSLLHRRVTVGSADVLVYRAIGIGMAMGGLWLTRLAG